MTFLIPILVRRLRITPWLAEVLSWGIVLLLVVLAIWWLRADAYRDGVRATDAKWAEASARMQAATVRATNAADALARQREAENAATIEDLRDEAAKGSDEPVGPGVKAVLSQLRAQPQ